MITEQQKDHCPVCLNEYNSTTIIPMFVCSQQHLCCKDCLEQSLKANRSTFKCPLCRKINNSPQTIQVFHYFFYFNGKLQEIKRQNEVNCKNKRNEADALEYQKDRRMKIITSINKDDFSQKQIVLTLIDEAKVLCQFGKYKQASEIYKTIIERTPQEDYGQFIGFGSYEESVGFYENKVFDWFKKRYNNRQISVYDLLAMCHLAQGKYQSHIFWYQRMVKKHPKNYKLIYGLALTQHNSCNFEEAFILYQQLTSLVPGFSKPFEMLAFIHFQYYQRNIKYVQYAQSCLKIQPNNFYARFMMASFKLHSVKECVSSLVLDFRQQQSQFVRPLFQLGAHHFQNDRQRFSPYYLDQCISINPSYFDPALLKVISKSKITFAFERCKELLQKLLIQYRLTNFERQLCYKWLGFIYSKQSKYRQVIQTYRLGYADGKNLDPTATFNYIYALYKHQNSQKSITAGQQILSKNPDNRKLSMKINQCLITILYKSGQYELAIEKFLLCLEKKQIANNRCYYYLAQSYKKVDNLEQSQKWCRYCLEHNIQVSLINLCLISIHTIRQQSQQALHLAIQCLEDQQFSEDQCGALEQAINNIGKNIKSKRQKLKEKKEEKERNTRI